MAVPFKIDFKFCGTFSGKDFPVSKWMKKLDWELKDYEINGIVRPHRFTQTLDLLFINETTIWAESHPRAVHIFQKTFADVIDDDVRILKNFFTERFFSKSADIASVSFNVEFRKFRQADENFAVYYKRTFSIMQRVNMKDQSELEPLTFLKMAMLDNVMRAFFQSFSDINVQKKCD